ncbi:MAG: acetyl-CoA C-acyltransferase [Bacteroidetes bacterium]|nr:acetyl-CoA C-acyltransferase [Bacteroidota bacterium]MDA1119192.1 acetyl-CoA C-acyltransferase [Bacteroidota bacterium]
MGDVFLIEGTRIPFLRSGTDYQDLMAYQLGAMAIRGLLVKTAIDPAIVDRVILGTVVHNISTANVAREAALTAGIPNTTPALTVSQACISANAAICHGADLIRTGQADVIIAGGTECVSDIPISFPKKMRKKLFNAQKIRGFGDMLKFGLSLRPSDFKPAVPTISEFSTGRTMGLDCDLMAARYEVSREEQDQFSERSHQLAAKAEADGILDKEISKAEFPPKFEAVIKDNTIRADTTVEKLSKLRPAFDKKHGTLTAGNSSFLTDGASAVLLLSQAKMKELGMTAKAKILDYVFTGQDPNEELLLGPAYASYKILKRQGLGLKDFSVFEYHEAFAAQILTNLKCIDSDRFAKDKIGVAAKLGEIPLDKFNIHGGSLSLGHPFGATGARLMTTAANRLQREDGDLALIAACAAGAHGHAMILARV